MTDPIRLRTGSTEETRALGRALGAVLRPGDAVFLVGGLGAGKTQLTKGIAAGLGIGRGQEVTSPTFTLINEHRGAATLYHVDLYRLETASELDDLGIDEILDSDGVCVVEWPDRFFAALGRPAVTIRIEAGETDEERRFELECTDPGRQGEIAAAAAPYAVREPEAT